MQNPTAVHELDALASNVPTHEYGMLDRFSPDSRPGASRYRYTFPTGERVDSLLVTRNSSVLVVSLHGAIDRRRYGLPRFERLRTLRTYNVSSLYIGDPSLWLDSSLELAWFTGWENLDFYPILADMISRAAAAVSADNIWINGGSGGGFAALQVAALLPGSMAIVYNPQTSIHRYLHPRWPFMPQKKYLKHVWPDLNVSDFTQDWTLPMGDRLSAVRRYSTPKENRVVYLINEQDQHHVDDHLLPFLDNCARPESVRVTRYNGGEGHIPVNPAQFGIGLRNAASWCEVDIDG